jgi:hypothetical protein
MPAFRRLRRGVAVGVLAPLRAAGEEEGGSLAAEEELPVIPRAQDRASPNFMGLASFGLERAFSY